MINFIRKLLCKISGHKGHLKSIGYLAISNWGVEHGTIRFHYCEKCKARCIKCSDYVYAAFLTNRVYGNIDSIIDDWLIGAINNQDMMKLLDESLKAKRMVYRLQGV